MATDFQELPPDAPQGPTAELVATQLGLHLATICARSKPFHIVSLFALIWGHSARIVLCGYPQKIPQLRFFLFGILCSALFLAIALWASSLCKVTVWVVRGVVGAPTQGSPKWQVSKASFRINVRNPRYLHAWIKIFDV
jgi:hypothetical protein